MMTFILSKLGETGIPGGEVFCNFYDAIKTCFFIHPSGLDPFRNSESSDWTKKFSPNLQKHG